MGHVQGLHESFKGNERVVILALNVGDENADAASWWAESEYSFPMLHDADTLVESYGVMAFPSSVLIGPDGKVVASTLGSAHALKGALEKALAARAPASVTSGSK